MEIANETAPGSGRFIAFEKLLWALAFAANEAWFLASFYNIGISGNLQEGTSFFSHAYELSLPSFIVVLVALRVGMTKLRPVLEKTGAIIAIAILMSIATFLMFASTLCIPESLEAELCFAFGSIAMGATCAVYACMLGIKLEGNGRASAVIAILGGEALAALVYNFMLAFPGPIYWTATALLPVASATCLAVTNKIHESTTARTRSATDIMPYRVPKRRYLIGFLFCAFIVGVANEANTFLYGSIGATRIDHGEFAFSQSIVVLVIVGFCLTFLVIHSNGLFKHNAARAFYWSIFALLFTSTIALPLTEFFPNLTSVYIIFRSIDTAAYECFFLIIWIVPVAMSSASRSVQAEFLASTRLSWALGQLAGLFISSQLQSNIAIETVYLYSSGVIGLLLVAFLVLYPERPFNELCKAAFPTCREQQTNTQEQDHSDSTQGRLSISELAERYKLSQREAQIAELLAQGRNGIYIQERLCLSKSTVSTHRQHIYQKLGIHNQQDLIDLCSTKKRHD